MKAPARRLITVVVLAVALASALALRLVRPSTMRAYVRREVPAAASWFEAPRLGFESVDGHLRTRMQPSSRDTSTPEVVVEAPSAASAPFELRERGGRRSARVRLPGAAPAAATLEQGSIVYRGAYDGVDLVALADGEALELLYVAHRIPGEGELRLGVTLAERDVLEEEPTTHGIVLRDARRQVKLRVAQPIAVDSHGHRRAGEYRVVHDELTMSFDWRGMESPVVIDPTFALPFWSILSDQRVPAEAVYDPTLLSRESHLSFDSLRDRTVLVRPVRSQLDTDLTFISGNSAQPINAVRSILPQPRTHLIAPFPAADATEDWQRAYDLESETWEWFGGQWSIVESARLPGLIDPAMAFDAARGITVLYGGAAPGGWACTSEFAGSATCGQNVQGHDNASATYEYDGVSWTAKYIPGSPPPRLRSAMAWSPALGQTLLFGGRAFGTPATQIVSTGGPPYPENLTTLLMGDTWTYDGSTWAEVPTGDSPPAMEGAQLVYDAQRKVFVLVGGHTANEVSPVVDRLGIWEFDGTDWSQKLAPADPSQPVSIGTRYGASAFYNPLRQRVTLFGGTVAKLDFCSLSDSQIATQLAATQSDPVGRRALQASGCLGGYVHDSWEWDGSALTKVSDVVFGGTVGSSQQPVFEQVAGAAAWATEGEAPASDGGAIVASGPTSLLSYRYDRSGNHFPLRTTLERAHYPLDAGAPPALESTSGAEVASSGAAVSPLFAARVHADVVFDTGAGVATLFIPDTAQVYDTDGASFTARTPPRTPFSNGPNDFLAAAWDSAQQRIVAFDPRDASTWAYTDAVGWSQLPVAGPPPWGVDASIHCKRDFIRTAAEKGAGTEAAAFMAAIPQMPRMTFDRLRGRFVMLYQRATWEFDGAVWTSFAFPPSWGQCSAATLLAFDGTHGQTVAFGCNVPADTWTWNGSQWTGPGPGPFTAILERTTLGITLVQPGGLGESDWFAPLQLALAHPNAAFESPTLGGVSTLDADGTVRTWNGATWVAGPQIASQGFCFSSVWDPSQSGYPSQGGAPFAVTELSGGVFPQNDIYWTGRELMPTCISPPIIEDPANARLLAFRDGPLGMMELPFAGPESQWAWRFVRLGTEGELPNTPNVVTTVQANPYPFEVMAPETVHLLTQSNPGSRTGQFGSQFTAPTVPERVVPNLWWPYRVFVDPNTQAVRVMTSRGMVWQLQGENINGLGDQCQSDSDCGTGFCGTEGVCCDLGKLCTQTMCMTCRGSVPGTCGPALAGQPDPSGQCGMGPCTGTCSGGGNVTACSYNATLACGPATACANGMVTSGSHCSAVSGACVVGSSSPQPCPQGLGCQDPTACATGCVQRTDCASPFSECSPQTGTCAPDVASQLATQQGISPAPVHPPPRLTNAEIARMLDDAGVTHDDAGLYYLGSLDPNAITNAAFDPTLTTPALSMRNCMQYIETCAFLNGGNIDGCVAQAPRCATSTPWLGDPAGIECCPESCLVQYMTTRASSPAGSALVSLAASTCILPADAGLTNDGGGQ